MVETENMTKIGVINELPLFWLFLYSISYMMLLCLGMVVDSLPVTHHLLTIVLHYLHL